MIVCMNSIGKGAWVIEKVADLQGSVLPASYCRSKGKSTDYDLLAKQVTKLILFKTKNIQIVSFIVNVLSFFTLELGRNLVLS